MNMQAMKYTPSPLFVGILLLVIAGTLSMCAYGCEKDNSFGCVVWVDCAPCEGGYCWIGEKK